MGRPLPQNHDNQSKAMHVYLRVTFETKKLQGRLSSIMHERRIIPGIFGNDLDSARIWTFQDVSGLSSTANLEML
jgi:hypothetical protein